MRKSHVISCHLFLADEVDCSVIWLEVIRHSLYGLFDLGLVGAFLGYDVYLSEVHLALCKFRMLPCSYSVEGLFNWHSILPCVGYSLDASYSVGMSLAHATAPESVACTLRKSCLCVKT